MGERGYEGKARASDTKYPKKTVFNVYAFVEIGVCWDLFFCSTPPSGSFVRYMSCLLLSFFRFSPLL